MDHNMYSYDQPSDWKRSPDVELGGLAEIPDMQPGRLQLRTDPPDNNSAPILITTEPSGMCHFVHQKGEGIPADIRVWAWLSVFIFFPIGIAAVFMANKSHQHVEVGDYTKARDYSRGAWVAIILAITLTVLIASLFAWLKIRHPHELS